MAPKWPIPPGRATPVPSFPPSLPRVRPLLPPRAVTDSCMFTTDNAAVYSRMETAGATRAAWEDQGPKVYKLGLTTAVTRAAHNAPFRS